MYIIRSINLKTRFRLPFILRDSVWSASDDLNKMNYIID